MNANLTLSEIVTIAFILLLVFGPHRLPEMAKKAGEMLGKLRSAAASIRDEFATEYEDIAKPISDLDAEIKAVKADLRDAVPNLDPISDTSGNGSSTPDQARSAASESVDFEAELAAARDEAKAELAGSESHDTEAAAEEEPAPTDRKDESQPAAHDGDGTGGP